MIHWNFFNNIESDKIILSKSHIFFLFQWEVSLEEGDEPRPVLFRRRRELWLGVPSAVLGLRWPTDAGGQIGGRRPPRHRGVNPPNKHSEQKMAQIWKFAENVPNISRYLKARERFGFVPGFVPPNTKEVNMGVSRQLDTPSFVRRDARCTGQRLISK